VLLTKYYSGDQIEKNGLGRACSTYGGIGAVHTGFCWGNLRERDHLEDPHIDGRIILRWIFRKRDGDVDLYGSGWGQVVGPCECGNEPTSSIKCGEFLD
jgi:hypothetical protein